MAGCIRLPLQHARMLELIKKKSILDLLLCSRATGIYVNSLFLGFIIRKGSTRFRVSHNSPILMDLLRLGMLTMFITSTFSSGGLESIVALKSPPRIIRLFFKLLIFKESSS